MKTISFLPRVSLWTVLLSLLIANLVWASTDGSYLSCATPDQSIKLRSEYKTSRPETGELTQFIDLTVGAKKTSTYTENDLHRVLYFSNGETVVREFSTGGTVLTFKEVPLQRSDRGFEKKILISQSRFLKAPTYLQCRTVDPAKLTAQALSRTRLKNIAQAKN